VRAITLWQPWASLVAQGAKTVETRSWSTDYRGPLAIHAARRRPRPDETTHLRALTGAPLPLGAIIAVCELVDCVPTAARRSWGQQARYGDFTPGRWAWILDRIEPLDEPVAAVGQQGFWNWP
jgi:hypothetical protein